MAVVDRADSDVVPEFGVPLHRVSLVDIHGNATVESTYGPMSDGVTGSEGGRLISVGVVMVLSPSIAESEKVAGQSSRWVAMRGVYWSVDSPAVVAWWV